MLKSMMVSLANKLDDWAEKHHDCNDHMTLCSNKEALVWKCEVCGYTLVDIKRKEKE